QIALGIHLRGLVQSVDGRIEILRLYGLVGSLEFFIQGLNRGHFLGLFLLCLLHLLQLFLANALLLGSLGLRLLLIEIEGVLIYFHAVAIDRVQLLAILQQRDLYFPGSIPRENYSPFLFVFSVYLRPLSVLYHSTVAPAMGLPCISLATPLTVPVAWAKAVGMPSAASIAISTSTTECFFMFWPPNDCRLLDFQLTILLKACENRLNRQSKIGNSQILFAVSTYGIGSAAPACSKARSRNTQLSHTPQAASSRL